MIRITIELLPGGDESKARPLGAIGIANDGTGTKALGNYDVVLLHSNGKEAWRTGRVEGFPRDGRLVNTGEGGRRLGAYDLLYRALRATVGKRNA